MSLKAAWASYLLEFRFKAITSRETMIVKPTYFVKVWDDENPDVYAVEEANLFRGLSVDDCPDYEQRLTQACRDISNFDEDPEVIEFPSIHFGIETALADLRNGGCMQPFPSDWSRGRGSLTINGLVWMGSIEDMTRRVAEKLEAGFRCIKLKIGGQDFNREVDILRAIRKRFSPSELEIRLDANGAFPVDQALERLDVLSQFGIHSIEQPIRQGQWQEMARICRQSLIPIALDEELIGRFSDADRREMLRTIRPAYIILKPALIGGFAAAERWIQIAREENVRWWATSALESNIGLNAIAQWTATQNVTIPQGLGTGALYTNNIQSPLTLHSDQLSYNPSVKWNIPSLKWNL